MDATKGFEYMQERKHVHGDIAARNVVLTSTFQLKFTHFGLGNALYPQDVRRLF